MAAEQDRFGDLTGRTALVTGASEGIGRGLALGLARAGADIIACSRRLPLLEEVCEEIRTMGRRAEACVLDVSDLESIAAAKAFCEDRVDKIDILVNNAGTSVNREAWSVSEADWDRVFAVNLKGLFFCSQAIGSIMRPRRLRQDHQPVLDGRPLRHARSLGVRDRRKPASPTSPGRSRSSGPRTASGSMHSPPPPLPRRAGSRIKLRSASGPWWLASRSGARARSTTWSRRPCSWRAANRTS